MAFQKYHINIAQKSYLKKNYYFQLILADNPILVKSAMFFVIVLLVCTEVGAALQGSREGHVTADLPLSLPPASLRRVDVV